VSLDRADHGGSNGTGYNVVVAVLAVVVVPECVAVEICARECHF
jgi:hypothetical protein